MVKCGGFPSGLHHFVILGQRSEQLTAVESCVEEVRTRSWVERLIRMDEIPSIRATSGGHRHFEQRRGGGPMLPTLRQVWEVDRE